MLAIASLPRRAAAETSPIDLVWSAPEGCPESSAVRRRIELLVHGAPNGRTHAEATVEKTADGRFRLVAAIRTNEIEEARSIDAASCVALAEAFAVVVAFMVDASNEAGRADVDEAGPMPAPPPDDVPSVERDAASKATTPVAEPPKAPAPEHAAERQKVQVALALGGSVVTGPMPDVTSGVVASAAVRLARFRVGAIGSVSLPRTAHLAPTAGISFDMLDAGAFGAYLVPLGAVAIGPAVSVEATYVHVRGFGIRTPFTSSGTWLTGAVGARFEARLSAWLGLFARPDVLVPVGAPSFTLPTRTEGVRLYDPPPVALRLSLGAEFVLP